MTPAMKEKIDTVECFKVSNFYLSKDPIIIEYANHRMGKILLRSTYTHMNT